VVDGDRGFCRLNVGFPRALQIWWLNSRFFWQVRRSDFSLPVILLLARLEGGSITFKALKCEG
jgi:hypothetical protein